MTPNEKQASDFAAQIMSMNRHERRKFAKQNKIPIPIAGNVPPYVKNINEEKEKIC